MSIVATGLSAVGAFTHIARYEIESRVRKWNARHPRLIARKREFASQLKRDAVLMTVDLNMIPFVYLPSTSKADYYNTMRGSIVYDQDRPWKLAVAHITGTALPSDAADHESLLRLSQLTLPCISVNSEAFVRMGEVRCYEAVVPLLETL